jgi:hypothetical protein
MNSEVEGDASEGAGRNDVWAVGGISCDLSQPLPSMLARALVLAVVFVEADRLTEGSFVALKLRFGETSYSSSNAFRMFGGSSLVSFGFPGNNKSSSINCVRLS